MKLQQLRKKSQGFTIIEVLIVLAIAGLILLIVFLAVPALQRNSRNTQRKNDVAALGGSITEYANNNNGALPPGLPEATSNAKLGFYDATTDVVYTKRAAKVTTVTPVEAQVIIDTFSKCPASNPAAGAIAALAMDAGASSRNVTAVYRVETSGGAQTICQDF